MPATSSATSAQQARARLERHPLPVARHRVLRARHRRDGRRDRRPGSAAVGLVARGWNRRSPAAAARALLGDARDRRLRPAADARRPTASSTPRAFAAMPRGAYLVNVARGAHVVEADLIAAVRSRPPRAARRSTCSGASRCPPTIRSGRCPASRSRRTSPRSRRPRRSPSSSSPRCAPVQRGEPVPNESTAPAAIDLLPLPAAGGSGRELSQTPLRPAQVFIRSTARTVRRSDSAPRRTSRATSRSARSSRHSAL